MQETLVRFLGQENPLEKGLATHSRLPWLVAQTVKSPPAMWETWIRLLGREDPLEEGMATLSSILVWRIPMDRGTWQAIVHGAAKSQTQLSNLTQHSTTSLTSDNHQPIL